MPTPKDVEEAAIAAISTAPRITPEHIMGKIKSVHYLNVGEALLAVGEATSVNQSEKLLTICVITLENGFTVTGESACASPENYNLEVGQNIAYKHAVDKIWMLEGYLLKNDLFNGKYDNTRQTGC